MKKRRTLMISLLLVAALALGVGYAAISDVLVIDGTITVNEQPFQLVYVSYDHDENNSSDGVTSYIQGDIDGNTTAKLNISGFTHVGDKMIGTFTVKNNNDVTLYIDEDPIVACGSSATALSETVCGDFNCRIDWSANSFDVHTTGIAADAEATFTITLDLKRVPNDLINGSHGTYSHYFRIDLPATSVAPTP